jgi:hypothetical protein
MNLHIGRDPDFLASLHMRNAEISGGKIRTEPGDIFLQSYTQ